MAESSGTKALVKIDGEEVEDVLFAAVDLDLTKPALCEVHLADATGKRLRTTGSLLGRALTLTASPVETREESVLFSGTVHGEEFRAAEDQVSRVVLVAYDGSYRLNQTRLSRSFPETTVGDVVTALCHELSLKVGQLDLDDAVHPYLAIVDETPREFIHRHAALAGAVVTFQDEQLHITRPAEAAAGPRPGDIESVDPLQLVPGKDVLKLSVRARSAALAGTVAVRGWDPATLEALTAEASAGVTSAETSYLAADTAERLGTARLTVPRPAASTEERLQAEATAIATSLTSDHVLVDGAAHGHPARVAGAIVSFGMVDHMEGRFLLTQTRHVFGEDYVTEFRCTGANDASLLALVEPPARRRFHGVYPAKVVDLADVETDRFRVKLALPWLDESFESDWARVCQIGGGPQVGLQWFPTMEDEVLVAFIDGDPGAPIVLGGLYGPQRPVPFDDHVDQSSGQVVVRGLRTASGHTIELRDSNGEQRIRLETGDRRMRVELDQASHTLTVHSDDDLVVEAKGDLTLDAGGKAVLKGAKGVEVDAGSTPVDVKGRPINLN